jgi:hypothetical protein
MNDQMKSFYAFKGSWFEIFDKLVGIIQPKNFQRFSIWESLTGHSNHLLIVYGTEIPFEYQQNFDLEKITEPDFHTNFRHKIKEHRIHGYNEFNKAKRSFLA